MDGSTGVTSRLRKRIATTSAHVEAFLSSHAFEILFVVLYLVANILMFIWGAHDEFHHVRTTIEPMHPDWTSFKWFIAIARGAGYTLNLNCAIIVILACRLLITSIRDTPLHKVLPLDKAFPDAHVIVAYGIVIGVLIHVPFHFVWLFRYNQFDKIKLWSYSWTVLMGVSLLIVFMIIYFFALPKMRENNFHIFYSIHLLFAFLFFVLLVLHGMYRKKPETFKWVAPGLILYTLDRTVRRIRIRKYALEIDEKSATILPGDVIKLSVSKSFNYSAGQYAEIAIPCFGKSNAKCEWHPFTIASSPREPKMTFYIKATGDWTNKLFVKVKNKEHINFKVRGPFGAPAQHAGSYRRVVLISGGIGSTPFTAICKDLYLGSKSNPSVNAEREKNKNEKEGSFVNSQLRMAVSNIVSKLYSVQGVSDEMLNEDANFLADSISLGSSFHQVNSKQMETDDSEDDNDDSDSEYYPWGETDPEIGESYSLRLPIPMSTIRSYRARTTSFLHSTRIVLFLMLTTVVRIALVCIVAIWRQADFGFYQTTLHPTAYWSVLVDAVLAILLATVMGITLLLEISYMKVSFFAATARVVDFLVFLPLSIITAYMSIRTYEEPNTHAAMTIMHFAIFLPSLFVLLATRMYRSVGTRNLLDMNPAESRCTEKFPDVDFVWCSRYNSDDEWLRQDLKTISGDTTFRLHRYVTKEEPESCEINPSITMARGRPNWEHLFAGIAEKTRSKAEIGVFFCGPERMGTDVKNALRKVEAFCNVRGAYISALSNAKLNHDLPVTGPKDLEWLRNYGNNVRFQFREENF